MPFIKPTKKMTRFSFMAAILLCSIGQAEPSRIDVRVAIVAYEDFHHEVAQFEDLFAEVSRRDPKFRFQIAVGTYDEVVHWIDLHHVDLAVLTPGVFARISLNQSGEQTRDRCKYLATIELPAAKSIWASPDRKADGFYDHYHSVCLVSESSKLLSIKDLRAAASRGAIEFLFVHPMSVSGNLAPIEALRQIGIVPGPADVRFTYSHSESIRMLTDDEPGKNRVAFVWDDAAGNSPSLESGVRELKFPELNELSIPHDAIVAQPDFRFVNEFRKLFSDLEAGQYRLSQMDDWSTRYTSVTEWMPSALPVSGGATTSLDDISRMLLQYARSQPNPPRLALVLSGGGAKCSYQLGVVAAIEEQLAELRANHGEEGLDIALVVGTSGGAINSVPIAMGITGTAEGRKEFRQTWQSLDQRQIVRPSWLIRANMGIWFALIQSVLAIFFVNRFTKDAQLRGKKYAVVFIALGLIQIITAYLPNMPWSWLGSNHLWHHIWLWLSFGVTLSAWSLTAIGIGILFFQWTKTRLRRQFQVPVWLIRTVLWIGVLGLPLLQGITILTYEETLSGSGGMQATLAQRFPPLIDRHLLRNKLLPLKVDHSTSAGDQLQTVSRQVLQRNLLKRDLVITGSCLKQTSDLFPSDLYFYASANGDNRPPPYGNRAVSLRKWPHILLDVVMGSGSIFPVFPPRRISEFPEPGEHIELVDGGFAHNSPLEAAVLWGATHVIQVEATPRKRKTRSNFLGNATSSFRHLYRQAQLVDARSRGKVTVFSIAPEPPHICVLDFAEPLVSNSIDRGYRDAAMQTSAGARFHNEIGEPVFVPVRANNEGN